MKVDRARFLLLTTALSAGTAVGVMGMGCSVTSTASDGGTPATDDAATGTDSSTTDSSTTDGGGDGGACLANEGLAPTCEGASLSCAATCAGFLPNYKNAVGRAIVECILALPTCEGATVEVANCVQKALGKACADPTAKTFCDPLVVSCGGADGGADAGASRLPQSECEDIATGLNATGRAALTSCITEGTVGYCTASPSFCIDAIQ